MEMTTPAWVKGLNAEDDWSWAIRVFSRLTRQTLVFDYKDSDIREALRIWDGDDHVVMGAYCRSVVPILWEESALEDLLASL